MQIIKKRLLFSLLTISCGICVVSILAWASMKSRNQKNGFTRLFNSQIKLDTIATTENTNHVFDIAGTDEYSLYFTTADPMQLFATNSNLQNGKIIKINLPENNLIGDAFTTNVDSPYVTVMANNLRSVILTSLDKNQPFTTFKASTGLFTRGVQISQYNFITRGFDPKLKISDQVFMKTNVLTGKILSENAVTDLRNDVGLSTDGVLHYDSTTKTLEYVEFYSNNLYYLDTNLNLIYKGNTIDTINSTQSFAAGTKPKEGISSFSYQRPKDFVNWTSCVYNGFLFNNSKIKSDNENVLSFSKGSAIDVYGITNRQYLMSFYIPDYIGEKLLKFRVFDNSIIAVYKSHIVKYRFPYKITLFESGQKS